MHIRYNEKGQAINIISKFKKIHNENYRSKFIERDDEDVKIGQIFNKEIGRHEDYTQTTKEKNEQLKQEKYFEKHQKRANNKEVMSKLNFLILNYVLSKDDCPDEITQLANEIDQEAEL